MGMSASQARFLSLTARKNNVEFEGQQINQQRTTLSNESASYYSELCNMEVPIPPSIDDYTKVTYTFNDGAMTSTIISILPKYVNGKLVKNQYTINYIEEWQDDYAIVPSTSSLVQNNGGSYQVGNQTLRPLGQGKTSISLKYPADAAEATTYYIGADGNYYTRSEEKQNVGAIQGADGKYYMEYNGSEGIGDTVVPPYGSTDTNITGGNYVTLIETGIDPNKKYYKTPDGQAEQYVYTKVTNNGEVAAIRQALNQNGGEDDPYIKELKEIGEYDNLLKNEQYLLAMLREKTGNANENFYVRYVKNTSTGNYEPYFYSEDKLENGQYNNKNLGDIPCYTIGSTRKTREVLNQAGTIEKDASGRYVAITIEIDENTKYTYPLTTNTATDEEAYNDAMNQYHYKQHKYDSKIQEINAKLEIIQQQDKKLELKLKQLDTEENAISTEMDAVKKVISKNVESTFKTFNA